MTPWAQAAARTPCRVDWKHVYLGNGCKVMKHLKINGPWSQRKTKCVYFTSCSHIVFKPKEAILVLYTHFTDNIAEARQYKYCEQLTDDQAGRTMRSLPDSEGHPVDTHPAAVSPQRGPRGFAFLSNMSCKQEHSQLGVCCYRYSIREA